MIDIDSRELIDQSRRRIVGLAALTPLALYLHACGGEGAGSAAASASRSWKMGFYPNSPNSSTGIESLIDNLSARAELLHIHEELPWTELLSGQSPDRLAAAKLPLVSYARSKGLRIGFMGDLTDGLDRAQQPPQLRALGRTILEPEIQALYRSYMVSAAKTLQPDYVGLTAETNLVRLQSSADIYAAMVSSANEAATDLKTSGIDAPLMISVQVEVAWGQGSASGEYQGVEADLDDFPFLQMLGLSSYPYFVHSSPDELPDDYYSRLLATRHLPAMVAEGGWSSANVGGNNSSPEVQRRFIERQSSLLDSVGAYGVIQTLFADLDLSSLPTDVQAELLPFASIGLTDSGYGAKPALQAWDGLFSRRLAPGQG